jgi:predicted permease
VVVVEISLATLLLISAVLVLKSFDRMLTLDRGYQTNHVLSVPISLRGNIEKDVAGFYGRVIENVRALPGVENVALGMRTPLDERGLRVAFTKTTNEKALLSIVSPEYFSVMNIRLMSGRALDATDRRGTRRVAIVNDALARQAFPGENAVGRTLQTDIADDELLIVGVVATTTPETNTPQGPAIYVSMNQFSTRDMTLLVRTSNEPEALVPSVRARIWSVNPAVPLDNIRTLDDQMDAATASPRFHTLLLGLFAAFAVGLASLGIYGVVADWVGEREHEIGIRRALGARGFEVLWMVFRSGLRMTACGLALGILSTLWLDQFLRSLLFQVAPRDSATLITVVFVLAAVAILAVLVPALRASRIDPARALRVD